jgi:hypothetical protein
METVTDESRFPIPAVDDPTKPHQQSILSSIKSKIKEKWKHNQLNQLTLEL